MRNRAGRLQHRHTLKDRARCAYVPKRRAIRARQRGVLVHASHGKQRGNHGHARGVRRYHAQAAVDRLIESDQFTGLYTHDRD